MSMWILVFILCTSFANGSSLFITQANKPKFYKEFSVERLGVSGTIKQDGADIVHAVIKVENMKKIFPAAQSTFVEIKVALSGIENRRDGLWKLVVDYELHHREVEMGTLELERVQGDDKWGHNMWVTKVSVECSSNIVNKLIPEFEIRLMADWKRTVIANFKRNGNSLTIYHREKNPFEKFWKVDLDYMKRHFKFHIDWDLERELDIDFTVNFGGPVDYKVYIAGDDKTLREFEIKLISRPSSPTKYQRWETLAKSTWKSKYDNEKLELDVKFLPENQPNVNINIRLEKSPIHLILSKDGQICMEYSLSTIGTNLNEKNGQDAQFKSDFLKFNFTSLLDVKENSFLYPVLCSFSLPSICFKQATLSARWNIDRQALYKMSLDADLAKDGISIIAVGVKTKTTPYSFKIVAPGLFSSMFVESIDVQVDINPGKYLKLKSNIHALSSLEIEKTDDKMLSVKVNGIELVQADLNTQEVTLPDGRKFLLDLMFSQGLKSNKMHFKFDGMDILILDDLEWDVTNPSAMVVKIQRKGKNNHWGEYELLSNINTSYTPTKISIDWKDFSSFGNSPWPSPVETEITGHLDLSSYQYDLKIDLTMGGETYTLTL